MNLNDLELSHGTCSACGREDYGGPKGHTKKATIGYWAKVKKEMGK